MTFAASARSLVLEPVIEVLPSTLDATSIPALRVEGAWALARDIVALPGACEVIVSAILRERSADTVDASDVDEPQEHLVDYVVPCGVAIRVDGVVRAWPGCCADWGTLRELQALLDEAVTSERSPWMGHDGGGVVVSRAATDTLILRTWPFEHGTREEFVVERAALRDAVAAAWEVIDRFEELARPIIDARLGGTTLRSRDQR